MKILLISFYFIEYVIQLANELSKTAKLTLMLPEKKAKPYSSFLNKNIDLQLISFPRFRHPSNVLLVYDILKKIKFSGAEILHLQEGHPWFNIVWPFLKNRYLLINTLHDVNPHIGDTSSMKAPEFIHNIAPKYANQVIVHGEKLKQEAIQKYNISPSNIHIIPHGNFMIFRNGETEPVQESENTILFFGRIWGYKGLKYLIKAEPIISRIIPDLKIIIAGSGENFKKYETCMVNKDKFIIYNEFILNEMLSDLFHKASVVVLPYIEASQSGVVPLAYSYGKPVVVTDVGSIPEGVDEGQTGFIVPPKNEKKLAEAVLYLLKNKKKREEMGKNAYHKAITELSWACIAQKTMAVYEKAQRWKRNIQNGDKRQ